MCFLLFPAWEKLMKPFSNITSLGQEYDLEKVVKGHYKMKTKKTPGNQDWRDKRREKTNSLATCFTNTSQKKGKPLSFCIPIACSKSSDRFWNRWPLTLSEILTKRLKPSGDLSSSLVEMFWQKSFALVLDSTSNACRFETQTLSIF